MYFLEKNDKLTWKSIAGVDRYTTDGRKWIKQISPYFDFALKTYIHKNKIYYLILGDDNLYCFDPQTGSNKKLNLFSNKTWITNLLIEDDHFFVSTKEEGFWRIDRSIESIKSTLIPKDKKNKGFNELIEMAKKY